MSGRSVPWPLSGGCGPVCAAFPDDGEPPSTASLNGKAAHSNYFLSCPCRRTGYDTTRDAGEIALASLDRHSARPQHRCDSRRLAKPNLNYKDGPGLQQPGEVYDEGPISTETVCAAVERQTGVVEGDLRGQIGECRAGDIRRVRRDYIELAGHRCPPITDKEMGTLSKAECRGIAARSHYRAQGEIDTKPGRSREFGEEREQDAARAGAEIEEAERSIAVENTTQHGLDDGFGLRPRIERVAAQGKF